MFFVRKNIKFFLFAVMLVIFLSSIIYFFNKNLLVSFAEEKKKYLEVIFLDVGQGDATLIKTPEGQNILIDGGEDEQIIKRLGRELPWWDKKIDLMMLTHPHSDHVGGLVDVLKRYAVSKVLYTGASHSSPDYIAWLEMIKEKKISLKIINHPQKIQLGENLVLEIVFPKEQSDIDKRTNLNNSSIVAKLVYGQNSFLLTGDAEMEVERKLLANRDDLKADVLKVGHHGSNTSSTDIFLQAVQPSYAVIEVGENNSFGHPSPRVIKRLERRGVKIFRTDIDGSIKFTSDGVNLKIIK